MRRSISKIPYPPATTTSSIAAALSTSSDGGGRGRGGPTHFQFTVDNPPEESKNSNLDAASPLPHGHGRGRGVAAFGRGRGLGFVPPNSFSEVPPDQKKSLPPDQKKSLPASIFNVLSGAGRGSPSNPQSEKPKAETRQTRAREQSQSSNKDTAWEQLCEEEKVRKAVGILSRGDEGGGRVLPEVRAERGEGGRGRGRGGYGRRGRGRGGYGGRATQDDGYEESNDERTGQYLGDPAAEEKVAKKLGPEIMSKLAEGFEEMSGRVLPTPMDHALVDAYETNLMIECEPEYFMEEFGTNPDIDEKPPIPLHDALEKMKPFLMAYEGIQSQEEWEVKFESLTALVN